MDPSHSRGPALAGTRPIPISIDDPGWHRLVPRAARLCARAARAAGGDVSIVLTSDREIRRLNARDRGRNKPTNVLTYDPPAPGMTGEILLALGTVRREAAAAGKRPAHHLAHLVLHGALHLAGHDHHHAGAARRMEQAETRLMARLHLPNPWANRGGGNP